MNTVTTPALTTVRGSLLPELQLLGYTQSEPDAETAAIDRRHASGVFCSGCKRRGMEYLPHVKGDSYRIALVCRCGTVDEA